VSRILLQSPTFGRDLKRWLKTHADTAEAISVALQQLSVDPNYVSLRTHKLRGDLAGCGACSAGYDLRIVFEHVEHEGAQAIHLLSLGTHDQVY
jgi:mRNA interferase YafQ